MNSWMSLQVDYQIGGVRNVPQAHRATLSLSIVHSGVLGMLVIFPSAVVERFSVKSSVEIQAASAHRATSTLNMH